MPPPEIDEIMHVVNIPIVSQEFAGEYTGRSGLREMAEGFYQKTRMLGEKIVKTA